MSTDRLSNEFLSLGVQYYVLARAGVLYGLLPVPGNLFHHAIELLLKAELCGTTSSEALSKKPYGHNLPNLWKAYKSLYPRESLDAFDSAIAALHTFEDIRYPDSIVTNGMYATLSYTPFTPHLEGGGNPPGYHLVISDVDSIVGKIFTLGHVNPKFFFDRIRDRPREALLHLNTTFTDATLR